MHTAENYEQWKAWALSGDERSGADRWKETERTRLYDHLEQGERATWPKIEIIRNCTEISRCVDELIARVEESQARGFSMRA